MKQFIYLVPVLIFCVACKENQGGTNSGPQVVLTHITVSGTGSDKPNEVCNNFSLTSQQAKYFFRNSRKIDIGEMQDKYTYLPCYVSGSARLKNSECNWEIRAGGTAIVNCINGESFMLACDHCEELLHNQ